MLHHLVSVLFISILFSTTMVLAEEELDPPEILHGERLFLETRFAQLFQQYLSAGGDVNSPLAMGDSSLERIVRFSNKAPNQRATLISPFQGQSFSCRSCHMVDELFGAQQFGMRSYADFARRSPLQAREDGRTLTVRNSPALVNASVSRENFFLHYDGEFSSIEDLTSGTLTDRNFGWLPGERKQAIQHICQVIREDDGAGQLAAEFGGLSYTEILSGTTKSGVAVDAEFLLPEHFLVKDIEYANCRELFHASTKLIAAYTKDLVFIQDDEGAFSTSPYDQFLIINGLPRSPAKGETAMAYSDRLLAMIRQLELKRAIKFVRINPNTEGGGFDFHNQSFIFGQKQLQGLKIFFTRNNKNSSTGNCTACHAAPNFTDFGLHNIGTAQSEYDAIHGSGRFASLKIPTQMKRYENPGAFLPATHDHPDRSGIFREIPALHNPSAIDLGAWNILFNFDFPKTQEQLIKTICRPPVQCSSPEDALIKSIATFKTPGLRDLSHSSPFMHNGQFDTLREVNEFYLLTSIMARSGRLRNPAPELLNIRLASVDIEPLTAFLLSLNEDYN